MHKVVVYVTRGSELLVLSEPDHPEVGLQVPKGSVEPGETALQAAVRELEEESGLRLEGATFLGARDLERDVWQDRAQRWYAYWLEAPAGTPDAWTHRHSGQTFEYRWMPLEAPELAPSLGNRMDLFLPQLREAWINRHRAETRPKAAAYVTRGETVLVFRQVEAPEAGVQIPKGSIDPGESPEQAVLREVLEETGLALSAPRPLGEHLYRGVQRWHFFHLEAPPDTPDRWLHTVSGGPGDAGMLFECYFAPLEACGLDWGMDALLPELTRTHRGR
nr:NUDIX domain-containing protein [Deinobacterium chartae]